jgi:ribosomal protein S27AE
MKRPDDLTPQPLKLPQKERDRITCAHCGASKIHAVEGRDGRLMCGMCGVAWQPKDGK